MTVDLLVDGDGIATLRSVTTSHLSALLLIVPLVLHHRHDQQEAGRVETLVQWLVLVALVSVIFSPDQHLPLAFLPLVAFTWASARLPSATAVVQLAVSGVYVTGATLAGWGPFAAGSTAVRDDPFLTIDLVQTYILVSAVVTLTLVALVEERRAALATLHDLALLDELTGLPNRRLLFDRLAQAANGVQHDHGAFTVLLIDLDGFKVINDSAGHAVGDELLVQTARRLEAVVRPGDTVSRLGGDEFVVVCPGLGPGPAADDLVRRAEVALLQAVTVGSQLHRVTASIGVAHGDGTTNSAVILRAADRAMYAQKRQRRGSTGTVDAPAPRGASDVPAG